MSKLSKVVLGATGVWAALTLLHLHLNLGVDLASLTGQKAGKEAAAERFRVGFLPVT